MNTVSGRVGLIALNPTISYYQWSVPWLLWGSQSEWTVLIVYITGHPTKIWDAWSFDDAW